MPIPSNLEQNGLIESPADPRDKALSSVSPVLMRYPEACPPPFDLTITDQGANPSCVAHTSGEIKQEKELRKRVAIEFDVEEFYRECKKIDGFPNLAGTYLRVAMKLLKDRGIKGMDGQFYKISQYALIDDLSFEGIKKAWYLHGSLMVGFKGSNPGWQGEYVRPPLPGETVWQHAVSIVGYEKDYLIGKNHWGADWGNKSLFKIPREYLPFEGWAIVVDAIKELLPIKTGWMAQNFLQIINGVWTTTTNVNVRSGAGLNFGIIKTLPKGTPVQLTNAPTIPANGYIWTQIIIN